MRDWPMLFGVSPVTDWRLFFCTMFALPAGW